MLTRLDLSLKCNERLSYQMSSLFHGALMEQIPEEYGAYLHQSKLHPCTQHLEMRENEWHWIVCCMEETAARHIIRDVLLRLDFIELQKKKLRIDITGKEYSEVRKRELAECFYETQGGRYIELHFLTPTAFKQRGKYLFYPDIRCIYQSLMNKYDAAVKEECMLDEEALAELCDNTQVTRYDLKSVCFYMEGVKIPSFLGKITVKLTGTQTMANFARLLLEFGTYSGVGIKTALGMGAYRIVKNGG